VRRVLQWIGDQLGGQGLSRSPRLDAELLVGRVLGCDRIGVYLNHDRPLDPDERAALRSLVVRRSRGEPVAYLLGEREFYGVPLAVDERVLVPRPETELLVDETLSLLGGANPCQLVADVGTGSGAIAVALAHERPELQVLATDIDPRALQVAHANARRHGLQDRVHLLQGDLLAPLAPGAVGIVVSNPPYIAERDPAVDPGVRRFEPRAALFAGSDGLAVVRRLVDQAARLLPPGGHLLLEVGATQPPAVGELATQRGLEVCRVREDLAGHPRVVVLRRPAQGSKR